MQTGTDVKYFITDHLGSTNALTDASGNVTASASYDSFGNATGSLPTRYQYTGREFDNFTGLQYNRARWYDSNLGRFISEDPIGLAGGINQYGYAGNNSTNNTDSSGLYPDGTVTTVNTVAEELNRFAQSPEAAEIGAMVVSPEGRAIVAAGGSAALAYATAAAAAPVATTVGVGVVSIAVAAQVGIYTASLPGNPFVNGSLNPFGKSAAEVENETWNPQKPGKPCDDGDRIYLSDFAFAIKSAASSPLALARTVAVGYDFKGNFYASASSGGLDKGMRKKALELGMTPVPGYFKPETGRYSHAEENLVPGVVVIGTTKAPCTGGEYDGYNCSLLLRQYNVQLDNRPK